MTVERVRIGTRGSPLALKQATDVQARLKEAFPHVPFETRIIHTQPDRFPTTPLQDIGDKALFIKEIEEALLRNDIDLAVHSLKDMTAETTAGLTIAAVTEREDPRDCLVSHSGQRLEDLPVNATVGTASLRRSILAHERRPDLRYVPVRGNIHTRLSKVSSGTCDGTILAFAALRRLGIEAEAAQMFESERFVPAAGQGSLAVETRVGDTQAAQWAQAVHLPAAELCWRAERAFLIRLEGGCRVPMGAYAVLRNGVLTMHVFKGTQVGAPVLRADGSGPASEPEAIGLGLAERILDQEMESRHSISLGGWRSFENK